MPDVVKNKNFKTGQDWVMSLLDGCKTKEGKVDADAVAALCEENGITVKKYPNVGMLRMNAGNMLRSRARKRHGLNVQGKWKNAPEGFQVDDVKTENRDGTKIAKAKETKETKKAA